MALDTLNNGDSGLEARTKINAAIDAVNGMGGGPGLSVGRGIIRGYSLGGLDAQPPSQLSLAITARNPCVLTVECVVGGTLVYGVVITAGTVDPTNGSIFLDISGAGSAESFCSEIAAILATYNDGTGVTVSTIDSVTIVLHTSDTGSTTSLSATLSGYSSIAISGGGSGADGYGPSGEITFTELIPAPGVGKRISINHLLVQGIEGIEAGTYVQIGFGSTESDWAAFATLDLSSTPIAYNLLTSGATIADLESDYALNRAVQARMLGTIPYGGSAEILVHGVAV